MKTDEHTSARRYALFPLGVVLFPGGLLPLRIFEPRYLRMVAECLREQRPFVVAAIVAGTEAGRAATAADSGTLAHIIDWEQGDDGLLELLCEGGQSVAIGDVEIERDQLARASVTPLPPTVGGAVPAELRWLQTLLQELLQKVGAPYDRLDVADPDADRVSARLIELLPLPLAEKQALFEIRDGVARLRRLAGLIEPPEGA